MSTLLANQFTPRLLHPGSRDPCTPWNTPCILAYWRAHMCDLQLHWTEPQRLLEILIVCRPIGVGYVHRRLSSTMSMWTIWVCAKFYYHILTTFATTRARAAKLLTHFNLLLSFSLSCGTGAWTFKMKDSSLWVAYSSLNSGCSHCMYAHAVHQHQSPSIPQNKAGAKVYNLFM